MIFILLKSCMIPANVSAYIISKVKEVLHCVLQFEDSERRDVRYFRSFIDEYHEMIAQ